MFRKKIKSCALAKSFQKNTSEDYVEFSEKNSEHLFIDISLSKTFNLGGKKYWLIVIDNCINLSSSLFCKKISDLSNEFSPLLSVIKPNIIFISPKLVWIMLTKIKNWKKVAQGRSEYFL